MPEIREVLHRRTDLSTFVVHLTRAAPPDYTGADVLAAIARSGVLEARSAMGWAKQYDDPEAPPDKSQRVVCFSETPLEHVHLMATQIPGRLVKLEPYGVALTKLTARRLGANPIWYVDMTPGHDWDLAAALDAVRQTLVDAANKEGNPGFGDYYMARCPEDEIDAVRAASGKSLEPWIDPRWGLEAIIAHLAGFDPQDVSPFAPPKPPPTPSWI